MSPRILCKSESSSQHKTGTISCRRPLPHHSFVLGIYVKNLFNEKYVSASSVLLPSFPTSSVYAGDPRTWGVTAKYTF